DGLGRVFLGAAGLRGALALFLRQACRFLALQFQAICRRLRLLDLLDLAVVLVLARLLQRLLALRALVRCQSVMIEDLGRSLLSRYVVLGLQLADGFHLAAGAGCEGALLLHLDRDGLGATVREALLPLPAVDRLLQLELARGRKLQWLSGRWFRCFRRIAHVR